MWAKACTCCPRRSPICLILICDLTRRPPSRYAFALGRALSYASRFDSVVCLRALACLGGPIGWLDGRQSQYMIGIDDQVHGYKISKAISSCLCRHCGLKSCRSRSSFFCKCTIALPHATLFFHLCILSIGDHIWHMRRPTLVTDLLTRRPSSWIRQLSETLLQGGVVYKQELDTSPIFISWVRYLMLERCVETSNYPSELCALLRVVFINSSFLDLTGRVCFEQS
jgi:hypothetical protein